MKIQEGLGPCLVGMDGIHRHDFSPRYNRSLNPKAIKAIEHIDEMGDARNAHELLGALHDELYRCDVCRYCGAVVTD